MQMTLHDKAKFLLVVVLAGTGWFVIPPQIEFVGTEFAISYRMLLAGGAISLVAFYKNIPFPALSFKTMVSFLISGLFLYSVNYLLIYKALKVLPSGICALIVSAIIIPNALFGHFILKTPLRSETLIGAVVALVGLSILYPGDILQFDLSTTQSIGFISIVSSLLFSSFGTVISSKFIQEGLNLYWATGIAMLVGGLINLGYGFYVNQGFIWSNAPLYLSLWIYISVFVTGIVFIFYMEIVSKMGAGNASYVWILSSVIALNVSAVFEGMAWTFARLAGTAIILCGSLFALKRKKMLKKKIPLRP